VFDMDGTLVLGDSASAGYRALAGAAELLALLRSRGIPFRIFTNGTAKVPAAYAGSLRHAGLDVRDDEMMTPSSVAVDWFQRHHIRRIRALGLEGVQGPFRDAGLDVVVPRNRRPASRPCLPDGSGVYVSTLRRACQTCGSHRRRPRMCVLRNSGRPVHWRQLRDQRHVAL
jgi:ribonucleotide monophosphatase NagD (HAD superfamily)